jgi:hypothetical protein
MMLHEIEALRDRLKADLRTVEQFLEIARRNSNILTGMPLVSIPHEAFSVDGEEAKHSSSNGSKERTYGEITRAIERAIKGCNGKYNIRHVDKILTGEGRDISRASIATALRRLEQQGKIKVAKPGKGRRPTLYATI